MNINDYTTVPQAIDLLIRAHMPQASEEQIGAVLKDMRQAFGGMEHYYPKQDMAKAAVEARAAQARERADRESAEACDAALESDQKAGAKRCCCCACCRCQGECPRSQ